MANNHLPVWADGWQRESGIPEEDYHDFDNVRLSMGEVDKCLHLGYFPPGLILNDGETRARVVGPYLSGQKLERVKG